MASEDIAARGDASIKVRLFQLTLGIIVCCGQNVRKRVKQRQREEATQFFSLLFLHFLQTTKPCLLYTSPSPRDQRGSRMPSSA